MKTLSEKENLFPVSLVQIMGGIGNQMFQYAFLLALKHAKKLNGTFVMDLSFYEFNKVHNGYELESVFNISPENVITKEAFQEIRQIPPP